MTEVYKFKRTPYHHQVDALKSLMSRPWGGALLMEPRTGKTKVCVDYASMLHQVGKVDRVLVVCPPSVMGVWVNEIHANCPWRRRITMWDKKGRKKWDLPGATGNCLDWVIVNYDAFSTPGRIKARDEHGGIIRGQTGGRYEIIKKFKKWQPQLIILDESHRIKTPSAKKTTALWTLGPIADYRVIATGTALTKKKRVVDIYSQWKFLNPEGWVVHFTAASFKEKFSQWVDIPNQKYSRFIRVRNPNMLHRFIHSDSFAVTRDECFDLPPRREQIYPIELFDEEARVYDEMAEKFVAQIKTGEISEAQIRLVVNLRLAQITSGIVKTTNPDGTPGRLVRIGSSKLDHLHDRLLDLFEADEKVVVAGRFLSDIHGICDIGKRLKVPVFPLYGAISRQDRDRNIEAFRRHQGAALFVMQPSAGALGIDLSTAATFIWYSLTNSYVDWTQATDRIALSPRGTVIEYMLARGTMDELMFEGLKEDHNVVKAIHKSPDTLLRNYRPIGSSR